MECYICIVSTWSMANSTLHIYDVTFLEVFSGSFILCDFHHIKARETYIREKSNEIPQDILPFLTRITVIHRSAV